MSFTQSQFEFLDDKAQSANILAEGALSSATSAETKADNALLLNLTDILQNGNTASTPIILQNGSAAIPSLRFESAANSGIFSPSAGNIQIVTNGIARLTIQAGPITLGNTSQLRIGNAAALSVPTSPSLTFNNDLDTGIFSANDDQLGISTGGVERLRVTNNNIVASTRILLQDGTVGEPSIAFNTKQNSGINWDGDFNIIHNGQPYINFTNVGVRFAKTADFSIAPLSGNLVFPIRFESSGSGESNFNTGFRSDLNGDSIKVTTCGVVRIDVTNDTTLFNNKIVIKSPNGNGWEIYVDDDGNLLTRLAFEVS
jgi:hypothetical protein